MARWSPTAPGPLAWGLSEPATEEGAAAEDAADDALVAPGTAPPTEEPTYAFEGFNVEFNERAALLPLQPPAR